jgi:hypothetical protein
VKGWLDFCESDLQKRVFLISYEDLDADFELSVKRISKHIGLTNTELIRPSRTENIIQGDNAEAHEKSDLLTEKDLVFIR